MILSRIAFSLVSLALPLAAFADPASTSPIGSATDTPTGDTSADLRGYGKLTLSRPTPNEWVFAATSATNASTTAG